MGRSASVAPSYRRAVLVSAVLQVAVLFGSGLVLDFGALAQICWMALAPYWIGVFLVVWRRPQQPTRFDLALIRVGYLSVVAVTLFLAPLIWRLRGVL